MSKIINFKARSKTEFDIQLKPYPAVKGLPKWFLDEDPYVAHQSGGVADDGRVHVRNRASNATFKKCVPLLDGMSSGYIIPLWTDVEVVDDIENPSIYWKTQKDVFDMHGTDTKKISTPPGYHSQVFKYNNCWIPHTPKGYSCLIVSPIGHNDLPFRVVPAIVDTDSSKIELVFPLWVKKGVSSIVEKGTPIAQIIPFKRDNWESTFDYYEDEYYKNVIEERGFQSTIVGHYVKNHWSKKKFK